MNTHEIVRNDFPENIDVKPGYEAFFGGMMQIVHNQAIEPELGEKLRQYTYCFLELCSLDDFQEYSDTLYKRVYLGKDPSGWEAIMMCWKKENRTSIHSHPQFAAYNFVEGKFLVEIFKENGDEIELVDTLETEGGQGFFAIGEPDSFDNHIHRITCLSDFGHSLHIYSDDARKGKKYIYNQ